MAKTVFVFGAGASAHLGVPLMGDFIDVADDLRQNGNISSEEFELVFSLIQDRLPLLHAKSVVDLTNIESVFSLIEMGRLIGRLPATPAEEVAKASHAMRVVLAETVQESCQFTIEDGQWQPSSPYVHVAEFCQAQKQESVALITFNYDLGLDFALHWSSMPVDYGLGQRLMPNSIPLLKLHGSLNWAACGECGAVQPVPLDNVFRLEGNRSFRQQRFKTPLRATRALSSIPNHCSGAQITRDPALVPPSWNKTQYHSQFSQIWQHAARELADAQDIRVFGYSLPQSDAFFRDLLALGLAGKTRLKSFLVVDPSKEVSARFETLLGPDARGRFRYENAKFEDYSTEVFGKRVRSRILSPNV